MVLSSWSMSQTPIKAVVPDLIAELEWRGLLKDCTDKDGLRDHLQSATRKIYAGFDPTADSLTIGNLVPIMLLAHVKRAGHIPVVIMGGGTGMIGDPSGKSAERMMMTVETVEHHVNCQRPIFEGILGGVAGQQHVILNNAEWLGKISYIEALRDIGKHFSVNMMMQKESVKDRLNNREQGISYTEFSYMILQAYDFAYLFLNDGVTVQFGGSDQYGNIIAGRDFIKKRVTDLMWENQDKFNEMIDTLEDQELAAKWRKNFILTTGLSIGKTSPPDASPAEQEELIDSLKFESEAFAAAFAKHTAGITRFVGGHQVVGLTAPLVAKSDGTKFGKTETGAVWLTANRTSPYAYYQFWLNATDEDARTWIKVFTFLDQPTIEALIERHDANPGARQLQRTLAQQATQTLHGQDAMENAENAGKALFSGDIASLDKDTMLEVFADIPSTQHLREELDGDGVDMIGLLKDTNLASSNREAREFLSEGSVSINGEKITIDTKLTKEHLLHDSFIAIRRGKKKWHMTRWN